jgi:hypothetical protein
MEDSAGQPGCIPKKSMYFRLGTQYSFGYNPLFERIAKAPAHRTVELTRLRGGIVGEF